MQPLKIFLADDHAIVREGMKRLIQSADDMEVVGEAADGHEALSGAIAANPDILVVDVTMPGIGGVEVTRQLKKRLPEVKIVALTVHEDKSYLSELVAAGATGYVLKCAASDELVHALRAVSSGGAYIDPRMTSKLISTFMKSPSGARKSGADITARETDVLQRIAGGYTNKEIAADLGVSVKTVETYRARAMEKLGLKSRVDIVRHASKRGWL